MTPKQLKQFREDTLRMSQSELAEWLQISKRTYEGWEQGRYKIPPYLFLALKAIQHWRLIEKAENC